MNIAHLLKPRYLRPDDLEEEPIERTILRVVLENVPRHGLLPVVYFRAVDHGLPLTAQTNVERLVETLGPETDEWAGHRVQLSRAFVRPDDGEPFPWVRAAAA